MKHFYEVLGQMMARIAYPIMRRTRRGRGFLGALNWYVDGGCAGEAQRKIIEQWKNKKEQKP